MTYPAVIYTDLDGTLLDHHDYSATAALPLLAELKQRCIKVVPATSKTFSEVVELRRELDLDGPFIVENGAAVFVPATMNLRCPIGSKLEGDFWSREFGVSRQVLEDVLDALDMGSKYQFKSLTRMSVDEISKLTGLSPSASAAAKDRRYSETIDWRDTPERLIEFSNTLTDIGFSVSRGGRFIHLMGPNDKSIAMKWLHGRLRKEIDVDMVSIAAGDAPNDKAMLEAADYALLMPSATGIELHLSRESNTWHSRSSGPGGWADSIGQILAELSPTTKDSLYG